jgi:hypothetical protein
MENPYPRHPAIRGIMRCLSQDKMLGHLLSKIMWAGLYLIKQEQITEKDDAGANKNREHLTAKVKCSRR